MSTGAYDAPGTHPLEWLLGGAAVVACAYGGVLWLTAGVAGLVFAGEWPSQTVGDVAAAATQLPDHWNDPRLAWPRGAAYGTAWTGGDVQRRHRARRVAGRGRGRHRAATGQSAAGSSGDSAVGYVAQSSAGCSRGGPNGAASRSGVEAASWCAPSRCTRRW